MQAGDRLQFIKPFEGFERQVSDPSDVVSQEDVAILSLILKKFINNQQDNVNAFDVLEPFGMVTVFEASYKLAMPDESYLHVVIHGSQTEQGLLDFGLSLNEHLSDGTYNGGYSYLYDKNGLNRTTSPPDDSTEHSVDEDGYDYTKDHFMISDHYGTREALAEMEQSDDPEEREHAATARRTLEEQIQFDEFIHASGYDSLPPIPGEMDKVYQLILDAKPFPLHITELG